MRLGAVFPHAQFHSVDPDAVVHLVQRLEDAGYDHLLVYDHVLGADTSNRPNWTGYYSSADPFLEPLVLLAYIARSCSLELVTDVPVLPQRQSALVAKQVATLALLAPGRIRLGVGVGWNEVEYEALGTDIHSRAARMEEQIRPRSAIASSSQCRCLSDRVGSRRSVLRGSPLHGGRWWMRQIDRSGAVTRPGALGSGAGFRRTLNGKSGAA